MDAKQCIDRLGLVPHPEGGYYKETYRAEGIIQLGNEVKRHYSTGIYFLLVNENFSAFHRIKSDEMWHYYGGETLELFEIDHAGTLHRTLIGNNLALGAVPQYVVAGGHWFASRVLGLHGCVLTGCTVSPGFDFHDFEMADRAVLISQYPQYAELITEMTR